MLVRKTKDYLEAVAELPVERRGEVWADCRAAECQVVEEWQAERQEGLPGAVEAGSHPV